MELLTWIHQQDERSGQVIRRMAESLGVTEAAVRMWVYTRRRVPANRCKEVEAYTGGEVPAETLRPDIFADREPAA